nr:Putative uncharacterized protein [Moritella viscosa]
MATTLISKSWNKTLHAKVQTYKNISICVRRFSIHYDRCFEVDGWSLGLGWIQISFGTFSRTFKTI